MKKILILFAFSMFLAACGSKSESKKEDYGTPNETSQAETTTVDVIGQGESLVKASDCKTCHHATNKLIGPAHIEVAKKYEFTQANVTYLADKIIKGGTGVWGQVPMTAHADIAQADAEKMARYVLSLDGEKEH
jgi:cytochrome c